MSHNTKKKNRGRTSKHPAPVLSDVLQELPVEGGGVLRVVVPGAQGVSNIPRTSPGASLGVHRVANRAGPTSKHGSVSARDGLTNSSVKLPHGILLSVCVDGLLPSTSETIVGISFRLTQP